MMKQMLYYESVVPLSVQRHQDWSLDKRKDYAFAGHSNSVPLTAVEFPAAAAEYAIVFTGTGEAIYPAVILGLKPDENLYLDTHGKWDASYIPAFVRRYPFAFSRSKDEGRLILCIDEHYAGWNREGRGEHLFESNAERTGYLNETIKLLENYQAQSTRTQAFCQKLKALGLLEPMTARFKLPSGDKAALSGFMAIDRDKLKGLSGETLAELSRVGELELLYIHLQSMRNLGSMLARVSGDVAGNEVTAEHTHADSSQEEEAIATSSSETANNKANNTSWWRKLGKRLH
jgi:hypothetical protein